MFHLFLAAGLQNLYQTLIDNWLSYIFFIGLAVMSLTFLKNRQFREFFGLIGIAVLISILLFAAPKFFGKDGKLKKGAEDVIDKVNVINYEQLIDFDKLSY